MEEKPSSSRSTPSCKLKVAGAWSGSLEVDLQNWTESMLRREIAEKINCAPDCINLICAGRILRSRDSNLAQLGLKNNSKVLASRVAVGQEKAIQDEAERAHRLSRIRAATLAMARRHVDGSFPIENFNLALEDQNGRQVHLDSESDQQCIMMGLMLHANAKRLIKSGKYSDALAVLALAEESFSLCCTKVVEVIDNIPILQIDTTWCYFMLQDISCLSAAGVRLAKAREGFECSHGKDANRLQLLQDVSHPQLAIYLRLELLEGVVAYHNGLFKQSQKLLTSAQNKFIQLQVPDECLSVLMSMGFEEREAKRALRMTNHNVEKAAMFLSNEALRKVCRDEEDRSRMQEIREQKKFGMTPLKKAVDLQRLNELVSVGFDKCLAAEALRRNENDTQKALDDLTNPEINASIQLYVDLKNKKHQKQIKDAAINEYISMGFERSRVMAAMQVSDTKEQIINFLVSDEITDSLPTTVHVSAGPANSSDDNTSHLAGIEDDAISVSNPQEERDAEMEEEITQELTGDPLSDYDIEISVEGDAITEYLSLLDSKLT